MDSIPFITQYGKYWNCKCNKVLHNIDEVLKHQHEHALKRLNELCV